MKNKIPRSFHFIKGRMKVDTNMDKAGDVLHITRNFSGLCALNVRTGKFAYVFPAMIRNPAYFEFLEVY